MQKIFCNLIFGFSTYQVLQRSQCWMTFLINNLVIGCVIDCRHFGRWPFCPGNQRNRLAVVFIDIMWCRKRGEFLACRTVFGCCQNSTLMETTVFAILGKGDYWFKELVLLLAQDHKDKTSSKFILYSQGRGGFHAWQCSWQYSCCPGIITYTSHGVMHGFPVPIQTLSVFPPKMAKKTLIYYHNGPDYF